MFRLLLYFTAFAQAFGSYCNSEECPGFTAITSWQVLNVSEKSILVKWDLRQEFLPLVKSYSVQWHSNVTCTKCAGKSLTNVTTIEIPVDPCVNYTVEIYPLDANCEEIKAPAVFSQATVNGLLMNGTALIMGDRWAVIRWLEDRLCPNSSYVVACHGPNTVVSFQRFKSEGVLIFNMSGLRERSKYVCSAFTINSAGASQPTLPVFITTKGNNELQNGEITTSAYVPFVISCLGVVLLLVGAYYAINKSHILLPWRGSYSINGENVTTA